MRHVVAVQETQMSHKLRKILLDYGNGTHHCSSHHEVSSVSPRTSANAEDSSDISSYCATDDTASLSDTGERRGSCSNSCASHSSSLSDSISHENIHVFNASAMISSSSETGFPAKNFANAPSSSGQSSVSSTSNGALHRTSSDNYAGSPSSHLHNSHPTSQFSKADIHNKSSVLTRTNRSQNKSTGDVSESKTAMISPSRMMAGPISQTLLENNITNLEISDPSVLYPPPGAGTSNFATLKTSRMMKGSHVLSAFQERIGQQKQADWREQMNGLKRLRSQHKKQLKQLEERNAAEEESLKQTLNRDFDNTRQIHSKEMEKIEALHQAELEKKKKELASYESQMVRKWDADTKGEIKSAKKNAKGESGTSNLQELIGRRQATTEVDLRKLKRESLLRIQSIEKNQAEERIKLHEKQLERENALMLSQHEKLQLLEYKQKENLHRLKMDQIKKQHDLEMENQLQYAAQLEAQVKKRHSHEVKNLPKHLKLKEQEIRKQYRDAASIQKKQFKFLREERLRTMRNSIESAVGSHNHHVMTEKQLLENLREEERRKQADLESQYENSIDALKRQQNDKIDSTQIQELTKCHDDLEKEKNMLSEFQRLQQEHMQQSHIEDYNSLKDRIAKRKTLLETTIQQKNEDFQNRRRTILTNLFDRQATELRDFDNETHRMGIDNYKVVSATSRQASSNINSGARSQVGGGGPHGNGAGRGMADWRHSRADFMPS